MCERMHDSGCHIYKYDVDVKSRYTDCKFIMMHGGDIYNNKIELDFSVNLNPLGCPDLMKQALKRGVMRMAQYPEYDQMRARNALANICKVNANNVIAGNGASELILACIRAVNPRRVLLAEPGFYGYRYGIAAIKNCETIIYQLESADDYRLREDFLDYISEDVDLIILGNPINPTGENINEDLLKAIIHKARCCKAKLLLDESFYYLSDACFNDSLIHDFDDASIIVIRSMTKLFAIPGIRVGYAISSKINIEKIKSQLPEWNISCVAEEAILAAEELINNTSFIADSYHAITAEREYLCKELSSLGYRVIKSDTTYIMFHGEPGLYEKLLHEGILIRDCSTFEGLGDGVYRIAVRTHQDNERLIKALYK